jgi:formylglycine-generating enzyme required for sulfatase activity
MGSNPSYFTGDDSRPVERVSWNDVQVFIDSLNKKTGKKYRLPTEAEWEYAARGGNKSSGYIYAGGNDIDNVAWYCENSDSKTQPVGTKKPNELGIYDMSGNVWEWTSNWYGDYTSGAKTNPTEPTSGSYRVYRGGSWGSVASDSRVSFRYGSDPDYGSYYMGFRLVLPSP